MDWSNFGIANGLYVVIIGFGMVFLILCIISFVLSIFSFIYKLNEKKKTEQKAKISETIDTADKQEQPTVKQEDDSELVAVISAAIAASMSTTSDNIIVHSIRKTSNWNKTAISENLKNFYQ